MTPVAELSRQPRTDTRAWLRALELTAPIARDPRRILPIVIDELADRFGQAPALLSDGETLSYAELAAHANQYARWALDHGVGKGHVVCLLMPNRPEYVAIWLGVTRVGGVVALLNTNLVGTSLAHCIDAVRPRHLIVAAELIGLVEPSVLHMESRPTIWVHGPTDADFPRIDAERDRQAGEPLTHSERRRLTIDDLALHIYTSGTTGWPKAANVSHFRLMQWSHWFAGLMDSAPADRMYNCLPMYHSVGGVLATGAVLVGGGSVVVRDRFSAAGFWNDVLRWDCTLFQYIGELCRYLLGAEARPNETAHRIRLACGNGLRADVWHHFERRFRIPRILEFYAATEGNVSFFNVDGKPGAIGRIPGFLAHRLPARLIRLDPATEQPVRDERGHCVRCKPGEVGEAVGRVLDDAAGRGTRFEGYTDAGASEQKLLREAFEPGDAWFRTGDLMRMDEDGNVYFVDRIGDTYRWKGENVATSEVEEAIRAFPGIVDAAVYGVGVPGADGRAGMAALVPAAPLDLTALRTHLLGRLPHYARPLFLRLRPSIAVTATFKHTKRDLADQGYDPDAIGDPLYIEDPGQQTYVRLDGPLYRRLQTGRVPLSRSRHP